MLAVGLAFMPLVCMQVMGEIEAKSELVREQDREYSRVQEAHEQMSANLAIAASENRQHTARINQLEAEARRDANNRRFALLCVILLASGNYSLTLRTD